MNEPSHARNYYNTRELARKLQEVPTPQLAIINIQERWHCSRSTVNRIRKAHGLRSDGPPDCHPIFDLLPLLKIERLSDPLATWALGTDDERTILSAPLLSIEDLKALDRSIGGHHAETFRRRARTGKRLGFRIGKRWLFRPTMEDLARLKALREAFRDVR